MKKSLLSLASLSILIFTACASRELSTGLKVMTESEYQSAVMEKTREKKSYSGFQQNIGISATRLDPTVAMAQADLNARIYQWTEAAYNAEKAKISGWMNKESRVFISFYVPEKRLDDLNKGKTTWKIFWDVDGQRYEGKVEKMKRDLSELSVFYPLHNRWSTPYMVTFPVPTSASPAKLTLTNPVVSTSVDF